MINTCRGCGSSDTVLQYKVPEGSLSRRMCVVCRVCGTIRALADDCSQVTAQAAEAYGMKTGE